MIPRCKIFLFANDFTLPNKFTSFHIKDTDRTFKIEVQQIIRFS